MAIHDSYPDVRATVQDVGEVIMTSLKLLPSKYACAVTFEEHDFFQPQKRIADCYILCFILHNWSDTEAQTIIRNLMPAFRPGARVLINQHTISTIANAVPLYMKKSIRNIDVSMFGLLAGRERSEGDFKRLLTDVDPRLQLRSSICPDGSAATILEFQVIA